MPAYLKDRLSYIASPEYEEEKSITTGEFSKYDICPSPRSSTFMQKPKSMSRATKTAKLAQSDYVRFVVDFAYLPEIEGR